MSGGAFLRRALRAFAPVVLVVALLTAGMAFVAAAVPRAIDGFLTDGLRYDVASAPADSRDVQAQSIIPIAPGGAAAEGMSEGASSVWGSADDQLHDLRAAQPSPLRDALGRADYNAVTAPQNSTADAGPAYEGNLSLGFDPRFLSRVTVVEGHAPAPARGEIPSATALEVMASQPVADALHWEVGESRTIDLAERMSQSVVLSGIFDPRHPDDSYWAHTTSTLRPTLDLKFLPPTVTATVFADAAGYAGVGPPLTVRTSVWFPVDAADIDASTADELAQQTRKFTSVIHPLGGEVALQFRTDLPDVLEASEARSASSRAILATILAGPVGLAVAVEILVARLAASRLRDSLRLLQARGASSAQRRLLLGIPALAVGLVAAAVGLGVALLLPGGILGVGGVIAVAATALSPAVFIVLFGAPPERGSVGAAGLGRLRLVGEAVVLLATVASVGSVLQRGNDAPPSGGVDLVAAAVPLTVSLLGCIVTLRIYPVVLRRAVAAAHRSRGIAPFLGLARSLRAGSAGLVPVLAVLIGVSVAVFSGALSGTLAAGSATASESRVGADLAVDGVRLDPDGVQSIRDLDGVRLATGVSRDLFHVITPDDVARFPATLVLVDPDEFAAVQEGVPGALDLPAAVAGASDEPLPLAVSTGVAALARGETDATIDRHTDVTLTGPPLDSQIFNTSGNWVLADVANAEALDYPSPVVANQVLVRLDDGASAVAVTKAVRAIVGPDAAITTPAVVAEQRAANPAVGGIRSAALLAIVGALALSAAALALTTMLDGRSRRTSLALLSTLGLDRRQSRRTVAWELAPLSAVGLVVGVVLGAALSAVVLTTVNLRPFTAGIDQPSPAVDPLLALAIVGGFALLLVTAGAAAAWNAVPRSTSVTVDGEDPS